jgi:hypothetical protein
MPYLESIKVVDDYYKQPTANITGAGDDTCTTSVMTIAQIRAMRDAWDSILFRVEEAVRKHEADVERERALVREFGF